jgi:hypothetical protein
MHNYQAQYSGAMHSSKIKLSEAQRSGSLKVLTSESGSCGRWSARTCNPEHTAAMKARIGSAKSANSEKFATVFFAETVCV